MKKVFAIIALVAALSVSASAQRKSVTYGSAGVTGQLLSNSVGNLGFGAAFGFRNYNRDAFISFTAGAEAYAYVVPSTSGSIFGAYAIPEVGVAIGPKIFKWYPHSGLMIGYASDTGSFGLGWKAGTCFDIGRHFSLDFSTYYPLNSKVWTVGTNFIWRF